MKFHMTLDGETAVCGAGRTAFQYSRERFLGHYAMDMACKNCRRIALVATEMLVDGEHTTLYDFMQDNSAPDVEPLAEVHIHRLFSLKVNDEYSLNLGAHGTTVIKRIG